MAVEVKPPFPLFTDTAGAPVDAGYIYIGTANTDPVQNPIAVFFDAALSVPAAQPIRTIGGYPARNGSAAALFCGSNYSISVRDKNGVEVFTSASAALNGGDITLASGESLTAESGSSIDLEDGAALNIGDASGAGVVVTVAANARFAGALVPTVAGTDLGSTALPWDANLKVAYASDSVSSPSVFGTSVTGYRDETEATSPTTAIGLNQQTAVIACGRIGNTGAISTNHFNVSAATNSGGLATVTFDEPVEDDAVIMAQPASQAVDHIVRWELQTGGTGIDFRIYDGGVLTSLNFAFVVFGRPRGGVADPT
jgi:hypothetical protein